MKDLNIEIPEGYVIDTANSDFNKGIIKFIKKYPKSWEEYYDSLPKGKQKRIGSNLHRLRKIDTDYGTYQTFYKLKLLRDFYRRGWEPNPLEECPFMYEIYKTNEGYEITEHDYYISGFLMFETWYQAETFLNNFKNLIEEAKDLF